MYLTIRIDHEFTDPAAFAMFASGYAELCRTVGIVPGGNEPAMRAPSLPAAPEQSASPPQPTQQPAPSTETVRDVPHASPGTAESPVSQRRRGRPTNAERAAKQEQASDEALHALAAPAPSEPVKDAAPNAAEPAKQEPASGETVTLDAVKAALNKLIMDDDAGEEKAHAIKADLFPKTKLSDLDGDTLAKVYARLRAALDGAA